MITIACVYAMLPKLYGRKEMWSTRLIDWHFWTTTIGVVLYVAAMWIAGVMQGLMWRATNDDGSLTYSFIEALNSTYPYYAVRLLGGLMVLSGMGLMAFNCWKTATGQARVPAPAVPEPA
jgi:cytochrome c oxidase cbb3-type subunit 1